LVSAQFDFATGISGYMSIPLWKRYVVAIVTLLVPVDLILDTDIFLLILNSCFQRRQVLECLVDHLGGSPGLRRQGERPRGGRERQGSCP